MVGQMHYGYGRMAQFTSSFRTPDHTFVEVLGTKGRLEISEPFRIDLGAPQLIFHPRHGEPQVLPVPEVSLYAGEVADMHDAILLGNNSYVSLEETRNHIRTILALIQSAERHQAVRL